MTSFSESKHGHFIIKQSTGPMGDGYYKGVALMDLKKKLEIIYKAHGDSFEAVRNSLESQINDRMLKHRISKNFTEMALDFNANFTQNYIQDDEKPGFYRVFAGNGLLFLEYGHSIDDGIPLEIRLKASNTATTLFAAYVRLKEVRSLTIEPNGRYTLALKDRMGPNWMFQLVYHSTVLNTSDKLQIMEPAVTFAAWKAKA